MSVSAETPIEQQEHGQGTPFHSTAGVAKQTVPALKRLNYARTFSIGFGMLAISIVWTVYNAYIPVQLKAFGLTSAAVGGVMAIDNVFAVTVQPLFGVISDNTHTRLGRRLPYAAVCAPLAALALVGIAFAPSLTLLITAVVLCSLAMAAWRAPIVALMPDVTDSRLRSQANGIINFMGAIGSLIALVLGGILYNRFGMSVPFLAGAALLVTAVAILLLLVREPVTKAVVRRSLGDGDMRIRSAGDSAVQGGSDQASLARRTTSATATSTTSVWRQFRESVFPHLHLRGSARVSLIFILATLFCYSLGGNAVETFFSLYAVNVLKISAGTASQLMAFYAGAFILFTIPAGFIGQKIGRKRCIRIALIGAILLFIPAVVVRNIAFIPPLMLVFGALWTLVVVNAIPWITEMGGVEHTGTMTALYYLATSGGAVVSPILFGWLQDLTGRYELMFVFAAVGFTLALVCTFFVHHGEAGDSYKLE